MQICDAIWGIHKSVFGIIMIDLIDELLVFLLEIWNADVVKLTINMVLDWMCSQQLCSITELPPEGENSIPM